ncbi:unnamed protein product [Mycena citricolor]|uniref:F-box domain-containing protein n=1 Tax=Mycena citricolor TaxID=2018698 RepID=A0AAD2H5H5_9AGAR|nr:unnamed protein product [Mycena citricolor]
MAHACTHCGHSILDATPVPPSPCPEFIQSGIPSSDFQTEAIRDAISSAAASALAIEAEIERTKLYLSDLSARHAALKSFAHQHRSIISPFRQLPIEILGEIFVALAPTTFSGPLRSDPKWLLTRVCRRWRDAAVGTPKLWARIHLSYGSPAFTSAACFELLLTQQLRWSGQHPLDLRWTETSQFPPDLRQFVLKLLFSAAHRWERADLTVLSEDLRMWSGVEDMSFPRLRTLKLETETYEEFAESLFVRCPALEQLEFPAALFPALARIPWHRLRKCTLHHFNANGLSEVIRRATNLLELQVDGTARDPDTLGPTSMVVSQTLTSFSMTSVFWRAQPQNMLDSFSAPSLERLTLWDSTPGDALCGFLLRSQCPLKYLTLYGLEIPMDFILDILACVPTLEHLCISDEILDITESDMESLAYDPESTTCGLLPNLESLSLSGVFLCPEFYLNDMLRSRCGKLRSVKLYPSFGSTLNLLSQETLVDGIKLSWIQELTPW